VLREGLELCADLIRKKKEEEEEKSEEEECKIEGLLRKSVKCSKWRISLSFWSFQVIQDVLQRSF